MISQLFKTSLRSLSFHRGKRTSRYTYINLMGLLIGLTAFILIARYVAYEYSYDQHLPDAENLYRVKVRKIENQEVTLETVKAYPGVGPLLKNNLSQVRQYARILKEECMLHEKEKDVKFNRQVTFWADKTVVPMFGLKLVETGDTSLLDKPWAALISSSAAARFYKDQSPIGKTLHLNESLGFTIQGVFEDLPENSHFDADFIVSYATLVLLVGPGFENGMPPFYNATYTYLRLDPGSDIQQLNSDLQRILASNIPASAMNDVKYEFSLQPVQSIHLQSNFTDELKPNGNKQFVQALALVAGIILLVAWINFISLSTARALDRAREVGILKCIGSTRRQLMVRFAFESVVLSFLALIVAIGAAYLCSNFLSGWLGLPLRLFDEHTPWILVLSVVTAGAILASIYPALVLSSFKPVDVLKGSAVGNLGHGTFRKVLVGIQFFFALLLVSGTALVYYQVNYMRSQDLGMDSEQVLVLHSPRSMIGNDTRASVFSTFRDRVMQSPEIISVGSSACLPSQEFLIHQDGVRSSNEQSGENVTFDIAWVDEGYLPTLGMKMLAGRNFEATDQPSNKAIVNLRAALDLGFSSAREAVGSRITWHNQNYEITGVVVDAHYENLRKAIRPIILFHGHNYEFGFFSLKVQAADMASLLGTIENHWTSIYPNDPFDYFFLDTMFDRQYKGDLSFGRMFGLFSLVSILVALMGLISLVSFTTYRRTREIGIRKVLGASVSSINRLLSAEFMRPIVIGSLFTLPVVYYLGTSWLYSYAFHFELRLWMIPVPMGLLLVLTMLVVCLQSSIAASRNPVEALRDQ